MHSVTVYSRVGPELAGWLRTKELTDDEWLQYCLRESNRQLDERCAKHADELRESAVVADVFNSPILVAETFGFDSLEKVDQFVEKRKLFPTSKPKNYASSELIARFISKWFDLTLAGQ